MRAWGAKSSHGDRGFTLLELLLTVILLAILATIVVYSVGDTRADAVNSICRTDVRSISLAAEAYYTHGSAFPGGSTDMVAPAPYGQLTSWPGGTSPADAELVLAYAPDATHGFTITISGKTFSSPHEVNGDATEDEVEAACRPS